MGGGFEVAMSTDLRVASQNATFGLPESKIGFPVAWGGWLLLPKLVGIAVAKEIMFFGDKFGVDKAVQLGLVNKVLPSENFMKHVKGYAKELKKRDASLMQITKYMINRSLEDPLSKTNHLAQKMFGFFSDENKKEKLAKLREEMLNELLD
jgi:enoyl-CoA hydratase